MVMEVELEEEMDIMMGIMKEIMEVMLEEDWEVALGVA